MEWSTVVDAPVTEGMSLYNFRNYHGDRYGVTGEFEERIERVKQTGCSAFPNVYTLDELIRSNRAGPKESCLTYDELIEKYCLED